MAWEETGAGAVAGRIYSQHQRSGLNQVIGAVRQLLYCLNHSAILIYKSISLLYQFNMLYTFSMMAFIYVASFRSMHCLTPPLHHCWLSSSGAHFLDVLSFPGCLALFKSQLKHEFMPLVVYFNASHFYWVLISFCHSVKYFSTFGNCWKCCWDVISSVYIPNGENIFGWALKKHPDDCIKFMSIITNCYDVSYMVTSAKIHITYQLTVLQAIFLEK